MKKILLLVIILLSLSNIILEAQDVEKTKIIKLKDIDPNKETLILQNEKVKIIFEFKDIIEFLNKNETCSQSAIDSLYKSKNTITFYGEIYQIKTSFDELIHSVIKILFLKRKAEVYDLKTNKKVQKLEYGYYTIYGGENEYLKLINRDAFWHNIISLGE